jgi:hypothetical protein
VLYYGLLERVPGVEKEQTFLYFHLFLFSLPRVGFVLRLLARWLGDTSCGGVTTIAEWFFATIGNDHSLHEFVFAGCGSLSLNRCRIVFCTLHLTH